MSAAPTRASTHARRAALLAAAHPPLRVRALTPRHDEQREWDALWGDTGALLGVAACSWGLLYMSLVAALRAAGRGSRAPAIASYLVSTVHAALAVGGFAHVCVADAGVRGAVLSLDHQAAVFGSHPLRDAYLLVTAGYMLYDAATCAAYVRELGDRLTYAHHAVVAGYARAPPRPSDRACFL